MYLNPDGLRDAKQGNYCVDLIVSLLGRVSAPLTLVLQ